MNKRIVRLELQLLHRKICFKPGHHICNPSGLFHPWILKTYERYADKKNEWENISLSRAAILVGRYSLVYLR
jgi:hypothetical protein